MFTFLILWVEKFDIFKPYFTLGAYFIDTTKCIRLSKLILSLSFIYILSVAKITF